MRSDVFPRTLRISALLVAALVAGLAGAPAPAAPHIDLDADWQFRTDPKVSGESEGWNRARPAATRAVTLPHTWNVGIDHDFVGVAWYFREFDRPAIATQGHVLLHFGATFYAARIWLNGVPVGSHEGGYTAYEFDITHQLRAHNLLVVRIDNRPGAATVPGFGNRGDAGAWYDWWPYGGIVRDAWLTATGPQWLERQAIRTKLAGTSVSLTDRVVVQNGGSVASRTTLRVTAYDAQGAQVARTSRPVSAAPGLREFPVTLAWEHPGLWSLERPLLYRVVAELLDSQGSPLDSLQDEIGVRSVEIRDRHLFLNGERVRLTGITRHEDSPDEGLAETRGTMLRDFNDLKELHTTLTRPVHYPQNPYILDYADRHGILLIPEIPVWQFSEQQLSDSKVQELARQQMREMIEQDGNHPSIFAWSVANESATATPGGITYFRMMRDWTRKLDPDRYVSFADDKLPTLARAEQSAANDADFLMMNEYYGSWHGPAAELPGALDRVDALFPKKMAIISEFGYGGFFSPTPQEADPMRIRILREQLPILASRDWIAGAILWCYQDYKSKRNLWPGQTEGYVEHGLVDENRQRKPSFEVWKDLTAPAHIDVNWTRSGTNAITGFLVSVQPNGADRLPSFPMRDVHLEWSMLDAKGRVLESGERTFDSLSEDLQVPVALSSDGKHSPARLFARLVSAQGEVADEKFLLWTAPPN